MNTINMNIYIMRTEVIYVSHVGGLKPYFAFKPRKQNLPIFYPSISQVDVKFANRGSRNGPAGPRASARRQSVAVMSRMFVHE
jgi:hypothetical protein